MSRNDKGTDHSQHTLFLMLKPFQLDGVDPLQF